MELFRTIQKFPNYQISNLGNIKNKKGQLLVIGRRRTNSGYIQVRLYKDGKYHYRYLHRLIAETFVPNPNNYRTVNHIDGNKLNNNIENLEWASDEMQQRHAFLSSLKPLGKSFTEEQLYEIYTMFFIEKRTPKEISNILNRPFGTIRKICYGERCSDCLRKFLGNTEVK